MGRSLYSNGACQGLHYGSGHHSQPEYNEATIDGSRAEINGAGPEVGHARGERGRPHTTHFVIFHYTCAASLPAKLAHLHYTRN